MEHSYFTVIVEGNEGEHILFNTLYGSLAVLDGEAFACYQNLSGSFLDTLRRAGFITEKAEAEIERQRTWFERDRVCKNVLTLCIAPTYRCNFACPYCYEKGQNIPGVITQESLTATLKFVDHLHQRDSFKRLFVQWYGGEPMLAFDAIEHLSHQLIAFCDKHGIIYGAEIITNASLIDEDAAVRLATCKVMSAMPTIDGCHDLHNRRRISRSGSDSFDAVMHGIECLQSQGIEVNAAVGLDKVSICDFRKLSSWAEAQPGIKVFPTMLRDYQKTFGQGAFKEPDFNLYSREEFSWVAHSLDQEAGLSADILDSMLSPARNFCRTQLENYFVIDAAGDVYKCDGRMGYHEYSLFNICDAVDVNALSTTDYNPMDDPECRTCAILPLCKGQCAWDRELLSDGCHPFKYTLSAYIQDYRACFDKASSPATIFVPPRDVDAYFSRPLYGDGLTRAKYDDEL